MEGAEWKGTGENDTDPTLSEFLKVQENVEEVGMVLPKKLGSFYNDHFSLLYCFSHGFPGTGVKTQG
jgi:hypothetical protein